MGNEFVPDQKASNIRMTYRRGAVTFSMSDSMFVGESKVVVFRNNPCPSCGVHYSETLFEKEIGEVSSVWEAVAKMQAVEDEYYSA